MTKYSLSKIFVIYKRYLVNSKPKVIKIILFEKSYFMAKINVAH